MGGMPRRKTILIGCPHVHTYVRGDYPCDEEGRHLTGSSGAFDLRLVRCGQRGGRCAQSLCVLHRHNRGGRGSWFPETLVVPSEAPRRGRPGPRRPAGAGEDGSTFSVDA